MALAAMEPRHLLEQSTLHGHRTTRDAAWVREQLSPSTALLVSNAIELLGFVEHADRMVALEARGRLGSWPAEYLRVFTRLHWHLNRPDLNGPLPIFMPPVTIDRLAERLAESIASGRPNIGSEQRAYIERRIRRYLESNIDDMARILLSSLRARIERVCPDADPTALGEHIETIASTYWARNVPEKLGG
jgi:hypothetical protein